MSNHPQSVSDDKIKQARVDLAFLNKQLKEMLEEQNVLEKELVTFKDKVYAYQEATHYSADTEKTCQKALESIDIHHTQLHQDLILLQSQSAPRCTIIGQLHELKNDPSLKASSDKNIKTLEENIALFREKSVYLDAVHTEIHAGFKAVCANKSHAKSQPQSSFWQWLLDKLFPKKNAQAQEKKAKNAQTTSHVDHVKAAKEGNLPDIPLGQRVLSPSEEAKLFKQALDKCENKEPFYAPYKTPENRRGTPFGERQLSVKEEEALLKELYDACQKDKKNRFKPNG